MLIRTLNKRRQESSDDSEKYVEVAPITVSERRLNGMHFSSILTEIYAESSSRGAHLGTIPGTQETLHSYLSFVAPYIIIDDVFIDVLLVLLKVRGIRLSSTMIARPGFRQPMTNSALKQASEFLHVTAFFGLFRMKSKYVTDIETLSRLKWRDSNYNNNAFITSITVGIISDIINSASNSAPNEGQGQGQAQGQPTIDMKPFSMF